MIKMSQYRSEYTKPTVMGSGCDYNTLGNYYGPGSMMAAPTTTTVSGVYVTPDYSAPGYNTLLHDKSSAGCGGYFNIQSAYGAGSDCCNTTYTTRLCGGVPKASSRRRAVKAASCANCK